MPAAHPHPDLRGTRLDVGRVLSDGLFAGLIGAVTVIVVFLIHDAWFGHPLETPTVLYTLLFQGVAAARTVKPAFPPALAYTSIHLLGWIALGIFTSYLVQLVEHHPVLWYGLFFGVASLFAGLLWLDGVFGVPALGHFHLFVSGVLGAAAMTLYLRWQHPGVTEHLDDIYAEAESEARSEP